MKVVLGALTALVVMLSGAGVASAESYSMTTLHFAVKVGPQRNQPCDVIGDLYRPADATAAHPDPAILTTNGFGGSKNDQAAMAKEFAAEGYVVLSYSGLGFGGSGCPIELDDPDWDGAAAQQLVTFLGGGSAATDGTTVNYVIHDQTAHNGMHYADDPRVGMIGGSYGGQVQFAAADVDPRIDTIVPIITWNDLAYSLTPNNTALTGNGVSSTVPGVTKFLWTNFFTALGEADGISGFQNDPSREISSCPNFNSQICAKLIQIDTAGYPDSTAISVLRHASVESYVGNIRIPTMLMQGEDDTLFNLHEAVATYSSLKAQGTPVKMVWQSWGHSDGTPALGEFGTGLQLDNTDGSLTVEGRMIQEWFDHYLKGVKTAPQLDFSFFRPWVTYSGDDAGSAYASAPSYPIGTATPMYMTGGGELTGSQSAVKAGQTSFVTPAAGAPTSVTEISAVSQSVPLSDAPGTYAKFESAPLTQNTDVVGIPTIKLHVSAPVDTLSAAAGPLGDLALFFKLEDISPSGTATLPDRLISPARFTTADGDVTVTLPGIVHRFPAGDQIALIVAGGDFAYRGGNIATPVTIATSPSDPGILTLPVAGASSYGPVAYASAPTAHKAKHKSAKHHRKHAKKHRRHRGKHPRRG